MEVVNLPAGLIESIDRLRGNLSREDFIGLCVELFGKGGFSTTLPLELPQRLLEQVDQYRGQLSRAEFIIICVQNLIGSEPISQTNIQPVVQRTNQSISQVKGETNYVTREELQELESSLKKAFLETLDAFLYQQLNGSPLQREDSSEEAPELGSRLSSPGYYGEHQNPKQGEAERSNSPEGVLKEGDNFDLSTLVWWLPAVGFFGFGDTLTSVLVFSKGGFEANPLLRGLLSLLGGNLLSFIAIKTLVLIALAFISYYLLRRQSWLVPLLLTAVGIFLVSHNLVSLIRL